MFPFQSKRRWFFANRYMHLVQAAEDHMDRFSGTPRQVLEERSRSMRRWLKVRLVFLIMFSPSVLATAVGLAFGALQSLVGDVEAIEETERLLDWIVSIASATSLVVGAGLFMVSRTVGQIEADMNACMALAHDAPEPVQIS